MKLTASVIEKAFDQSVYAINITDLEGRLIKVNQAYLKLYEFESEDEILGHTQRVIRSPRTPAVVYKEMWNTIQQNKTWSGEIVNLNRAREEIFIHLTITPIMEGSRKIGYMGFSLDRSQQVVLEQQLLHANKLVVLGTLGAGIAHELNNPLTSISLESEILQESAEAWHGEDKKAVLSSVKSILKNAERMKRVIEHLLIYSRKEAESEWETFSLGEFVQDSFLFLDKQLKNREIEVDLKVDEELLVEGNRTQLESVLHNLLTNSRDAFRNRSGLKKRIVLFVQKTDSDWFSILYRDNAGGIPPDHLEKIFDPFFTTKGEGEGTGLGLSITKKIVTEHGGKISCRSDGGQTEFHIHLPIRQTLPPDDTSMDRSSSE